MNEKHGMTSTRLYNIWGQMKARCFRSNSTSYPRYGARGITVCGEWKNSFIKFYKWAMENGYREGLTIDRRDNNKNYTPENCRWATMREQGQNMSNNNNLTVDDRIQTISAWSSEIGISRRELRRILVKEKQFLCKEKNK